MTSSAFKEILLRPEEEKALMDASQYACIYDIFWLENIERIYSYNFGTNNMGFVTLSLSVNFCLDFQNVFYPFSCSMVKDGQRLNHAKSVLG